MKSVDKQVWETQILEVETQKPTVLCRTTNAHKARFVVGRGEGGNGTGSRFVPVVKHEIVSVLLTLMRSRSLMFGTLM